MAKGTVWKQEFYDEVEEIRLSDPLASILGAVSEGEPFVFTFKDAVKLAGHSCPAVSGAFMVTLKALKALYGEDTPVRSQVRVLIKGGPSDLAYGPQAQVISLITGAAPETGFKGLGGMYGRKDKLVFDPNDTQFNVFIFEREDTGKAVKVSFNPGVLPPDNEAEMSSLMPGAVQGTSSTEDKERFILLWQGKVRKILLESDKYPGLFEVEVLEGFKFPSG